METNTGTQKPTQITAPKSSLLNLSLNIQEVQEAHIHLILLLLFGREVGSSLMMREEYKK